MIVVERRIDRHPSTVGTTSKEGYLHVSGCVAVAGVLEYIYDNGEVVRELVPPETLKDPLNLKSMDGLPFCNLHPPVPVVAENWHIYAKGVVLPGSVFDDESLEVRSDFIVYDAQTIIDIKQNGHDELSQGYEVGIDKTSGTHPIFGQYDQIQIWRKNNHTAAVPEARAGERASLYLDSKDATPSTACAQFIRRIDAATPSTPQGKTMSDVQMRIDGVTWTFTAAQANAINSKFKSDAAKVETLEDSMSTLKGDMESAITARDEAQSKVDEYKAMLDELRAALAGEGMDMEDLLDPEKPNKPAPNNDMFDELMDGVGEYTNDASGPRTAPTDAEIEKMVAERAEVITMAKSLGFKSDAIDKATTAQLKQAIVARRLGVAQTKGQDASRIDAMYAVIKKQAVEADESWASFNNDDGIPKGNPGNLAEQEAQAQKAYEDRLYGRA